MEQQKIRKSAETCNCNIRCTITPPLNLPQVMCNSNTRSLRRVPPDGNHVVEGICSAIANGWDAGHEFCTLTKPLDIGYEIR